MGTAMPESQAQRAKNPSGRGPRHEATCPLHARTGTPTSTSPVVPVRSGFDPKSQNPREWRLRTKYFVVPVVAVLLVVLVVPVVPVGTPIVADGGVNGTVNEIFLVSRGTWVVLAGSLTGFVFR